MSNRFSTIKLDNYKPLRDLVFAAMREAILSGKLKPGERLMEVQLAEEMGVSRTPVREAIRKLELEGLVVMVPRKGAYVAGLTLKDVAEVFEIRSSLEGLAAALAADRITDEEVEALDNILKEISEAVGKGDIDKVIKKDGEFHQILFSASRNNRLAQMINNLKEQIDRFRVQSFSNPVRLKSVLSEHKEILDAIKQGNIENAEKLAKEHIYKVEYNVMNILRKQMDFEEEPL
ncbi:Transcriptional regulator, GntR family [Tepidanaerobacter acetatoxydans Re1]|uniref:Transcriptional regulator, GntR family n=1 Tax=Tepidanaerobacter acetatoxydans (strain DSM 21804 / JCM 16047 / Re1) TaxID=1209989 RepID=F4LRN5_TEPAE|nr:GntR family transcriptional regulator [Tepidanaerobacter acetatoxydans]AEE90298.1 transcriptional regulator, GntR family [Tepidanaerobacter acetatoxydans Re1]CCP24776.1 Transcriptional regulator, GntR family [Tepidanaerobacter acetatoxydans Re1]